MLEIKNREKIKYKVIGDTGFYINEIKESNELDSYIVEITDRKHITYMALNRLFDTTHRGYELKFNNRREYLSSNEIRNMDEFIKCISYMIKISNYSI